MNRLTLAKNIVAMKHLTLHRFIASSLLLPSFAYNYITWPCKMHLHMANSKYNQFSNCADGQKTKSLTFDEQKIISNM
jgi:hypothetical protein